MSIKIHLGQSFTAVPGPPSAHTQQVAAMFGLGVDVQQQTVVCEPKMLTLSPGQVVFVTGPSGGGKSCLLRQIAEQLVCHKQVDVLSFDDLPALPARPLVDCFGALALPQVLKLLSLAGLGDAFVLLRCPDQLSDGQRYRLKLAQTMAYVLFGEPTRWTVILADEFGATLDRITAKIMARNISKWVHKTSDRQVTWVASTTHDDLLEALLPDVLIEKHLGPRVDVVEAKTSC